MKCTRVHATRVLFTFSTCFTLMAVGCRPSASETHNSATLTAVPTASGSTDPMSSDTVRGIVQRVGNDPVSVLVLSSAAAKAVYALRGALLDELGRAVGLEVMIEGMQSDKRDYSASPRGAIVLEVSQFYVRGADGQTAVDGIIGISNGKYFLTATGGKRLELLFLPQELRGTLGSRVFLVGNPGKPPTAYGILAAPK